VSGQNQFGLLGQSRFAPFFITQFLGALNDNIFRNGLVILVTFQGVLVAGMNVSELANVAGALFILPFFLFSATAGQLADKYEKSMLMRRIKLLEIMLMIMAGIAFVSESFVALLLVLFLMGCQSTLFGPVKYAYLPQQLATDELIGGNALVEAGTYIAIILGLIAGGAAVAVSPDSQTLLGASLVFVAVAGYLASRRIPRTQAVDPGLSISWNAWAETWRIVRYARERRDVFLAHDAAAAGIHARHHERQRINHDRTARGVRNRRRPWRTALRTHVRSPHRTRAGAFRIDRSQPVRHRSLLRAAGSGSNGRLRHRRIPRSARQPARPRGRAASRCVRRLLQRPAVCTGAAEI
jgi:hypothetical protein